MFCNLLSRTDVFLLFVIFLTFLTSLILTICKYIKKATITFALLLFSCFFSLKHTGTNINFHHKKLHSKKFFKIDNQEPPHQFPPTTSQENPTTSTSTQNPYSSTRSSFQKIHILLKKDTHDYLNH